MPNQAYGTAQTPVLVPTGPWRSVESSWHGFFIESFIDELAHEAKRDPLEYRLSLLKDKPRHCATLSLAVEKAGWRTPLPSGCGRGIAMVECFGTIVVHVAEVEVADEGAVKVRRVTTAADCGMAVNPDGFKAQMEGAIIFGLSAALHGEITIDHGAVVQQNFPDYEMVRLAECPEIEVHIHESDAPLGGAGEPGMPPVAPAVTNAIFAATGVRIRELPIKNHALGKSHTDKLTAFPSSTPSSTIHPETHSRSESQELVARLVDSKIGLMEESLIERAVERVETEDCGVCGSAGRARSVPDFLSGFFCADVSGDQRFAVD